ncbi:MAG: hypothetical protein HY696_11900 [Deltaproteobacteria bacterium]|nr:hypothetical protein [Deltaproteobacteria bacterium]
MTAEFGTSCLLLIPSVALYSLGMTWLGARYRDARSFRSGVLAIYVIALLATAAQALSVAPFFFEAAAGPWYAPLLAAWNSVVGGLLGWVAVVAWLCVAASRQLERHHPRHLPVVNAVLMLVVGSLAVALLWATSPFAIDTTALPGVWRAPQLLVQRVAVWLGCGAAVVAGAFVISGWCDVEMDAGWLALLRRWVLGSWVGFSVALFCGMHWSYYRLGGGSFWNGELMERAVLLPWLTVTALLHGLRVQERRGMWRGWNGCIVWGLACFALFTIFAVSMAGGPAADAAAVARVAPYLTGVLLLALCGGGGFIVARLRALGRRMILESFYSKEGALLVNNVLLLIGVGVLTSGTMLPMVRAWLTGTEELVGTALQDATLLWMGLGLVVIAGVGPVLTWRRATRGVLWRSLRWPAVGGLLAGGAVWSMGVRAGFALSAVVLGAITGLMILGELLRGARWWRFTRISTQPVEGPLVQNLFQHAPRRYGGYVVHFGMLAIFAAGVGALYRQDVRIQLQPGEYAVIGPYYVEFAGLQLPEGGVGGAVAAELIVRRGQRVITTLAVTARGAGAVDDTLAGPAIYSRFSHDLSVQLLGWNSRGGAARFQLGMQPVVSGLWIGAALCGAGTLIMIWPRRGVRVAAIAARVA